MDLFGNDDSVKEAPAAQDEVLIEDLSPDSLDSADSQDRHPKYCTKIMGHEKIEAMLVELVASDRMPHALIFSGQKGIGKASMAYQLTKFLMARGIKDPDQDALFGGDDLPEEICDSLDSDPDHPSVKRVLSGGHPDFRALERYYDADKNKFKASLEVDQLRSVAPFLRMSASEGGWRIVLIDDADTMNRNAQNALLKILEEPPKNTLLILVAHRLGALIPTIKSRSRVVNFNTLSEESLKSLIMAQGHHFNAQELENLCYLSDGSLGNAINFVENGGLDVLAKILSVMQTYPDFDWGDIHALGDDMARSGQESAYQHFQDITQWLFRQLLFMKARGEQTMRGPLALDVFHDIYNELSLVQLIKLSENLKEHFDRTERGNLGKAQSVLETFEIIRQNNL